MTRKTIITIVQLILFIGIIAILYIGVSYICNPSDKLKAQNLTYESEIEESIDIAFVGSSSTYAYYDIMYIWEEYGITSETYAVASLGFDTTLTMVEMVEANQSPEIYVFDLRGAMTDEFNAKQYGSYDNEWRKTSFINVLNVLPYNLQRVSAVMSSELIQWNEKYMYIFDVLYYHEGFQDGVETIIEDEFVIEGSSYKANKIMYKMKDQTENYTASSTITETDYILTDATYDRMVELLEYCVENEINAYFTLTPYMKNKNVNDKDIRLVLGELVASYGYPFTDYRDEFDEIGLDLSTDFADANHVNAIGAKIFSAYSMEDILDVYDVDTDYSQEVIDSWDSTYEEWLEYDTRRINNLYADLEEDVAEEDATDSSIDSSSSE